MNPFRMLARPMQAAMFIAGGLDAVRDPSSKRAAGQDVGVPIARKMPISLPEDPDLLVRINGGVQLAFGGLLAIGKLRRTSALALAATLVPTTYGAHRFWEEQDDQSRANQLQHFLKNVSMAGGLLMTAFAPTQHRLRRKAERAAYETRGRVKGRAEAVKVAGKGVARGASTAARKVTP